MRRFGAFLTLICFMLPVFLAACEKKEEVKMGETLFKQHCSPCHSGGGNNVNPQKTLHKKDREANGVKTAADIMGKMRNPGPGMTKFDDKTVPDADARAIAEYVFKTF